MEEAHLENFVMDYSVDTSFVLGSLFHLYCKPARDFYMGIQSSDKSLVELQAGFISGLEKAIHGDLSESDGIGNTHLRHMFVFAKRDWSLSTVKSIYEYYHNIMGMNYNEQELFPQK